MATIYTSDSMKYLRDFINEIIDNDSTIVIPDLQRPYIWNPQQVILLVDSIFKKWPFGSFLCWRVKLESNASDYIPYRPFWEEFVSKSASQNRENSRKTSIKKSHDTQYLMILDGQQRLQSLLFALGGESWGVTFTDKEWKKYIEGTDENIDERHWSSACLCLDISSFLLEYANCNQKISGIDVGKCLAWAVTDENTGLSSRDKKQVLPVASSCDGKFVRFSKIWNAAKPLVLTPKGYEEELQKVFSEIPHEKLKAFINPLSEFMMIVAEVKESTLITCLTIRDYKNSGIEDKSVYNNAIVNIFARLNTAGRALTSQEITLAWLKTGWQEANEKADKQIDCSNALEELLTELNDYDDATGMQMSMDNLVDILSLFWIIAERSGDNKNEIVLSDKDLVNGNIMKNIGSFTFKFWEVIKEVILECKDAFEHRKLNECFARSFSAFYIICGWKFIVADRALHNEGRIRETECKFTIQINAAFDMFIDKWYFSTLLADTWSNRDNYPNFVGRLCVLRKAVSGCNDPCRSTQILIDALEAMLLELKETVVNRIRSLRKYERKGVIAYKNILWLWNRLSMERWNEVQKPMKRKKATPKLEVDHAIPVAIWESKIESEYPLASSRDTTGQELSFDINGLAYKRSSLLSEIHALGNCSLLLRSHNRSKSDEPFGDFLNDIYTTEQQENVKNALLLNGAFLAPSTVTIEQIVKEINIRTEKIKSELIDYFDSKEKTREDV